MQNVLVIGAPRSGTTLVAGLLSADERVCPMLPECSYMTQAIEHYYNFLHFSDPQRFAVYATSEARLTEMYQGLITSMLQTVLEQFKEGGYQYLVLKDPELTIYVDLIPKFFGVESKTIQVVRDPRAVIASMMKVEKKKRRRILKEIARDWNVSNVIQFINSINQTIWMPGKFLKYYSAVHESRLKKESRMLTVSYEKLIGKDEAEFQRLENYLGIKVSRTGFGKVYVDFDRSDPTFSRGYGQVINSDKRLDEPRLTWFQNKRIKKLFSELNCHYSWW